MTGVRLIYSNNGESGFVTSAMHDKDGYVYLYSGRKCALRIKPCVLSEHIGCENDTTLVTKGTEERLSLTILVGREEDGSD